MKYKELNLLQLFLIIKKRFIFILLFVLLSGCLSYIISEYLITPRYTSSASLYVYSTNRILGQVTSSDLTASQELVNTYIIVLKSDTVLEKVITELKLSMSTKDIRKILSAESIDGTEAFKISITHRDPNMAQQLVNTIVNVGLKEIVRVVQAGGAEVIDYAKVLSKPSLPNMIVNTILGLLIGFVIALAICTATVVFDTKVHREEDLTMIFKIPVIGSVPTLVKQ